MIKVNILADALSINDIEITDINLTADITVAGVGGLQTGLTEATDTWYSVWVIHNQTDSLTRALLATSATDPTLPTNYTKKRSVGWVRNDGSSNFLKFYNMGDWIFYDDPYGNAELQVIDVTADVNIWTAASCASKGVPPTSRLAKINGYVSSASNLTANFRPTGSSATQGIVWIEGHNTITTHQTANIIEIPLNSAQSFDYKASFQSVDFDAWVSAYYDQI